MVEKTNYLAGRKVLIVEDEYLLADELARVLRDAGAELLGPVKSARAALEILASGQRPDLAVLDIDLQGDEVYSVSDTLTARGIPFVFSTGFSAEAVTPRYRHISRVVKPYRAAALHDVLRSRISEFRI